MKNKLILFYSTLWGVPWENIRCDAPAGFVFTRDRRRLAEADAVVFHLPDLRQQLEGDLEKREGQIWVAWSLESEENYPWLMKDEEVRSYFDLWMGYHQTDDVLHTYYTFIDRKALTSLPAGLPSLNKACLFISSPFNQSHRLEYVRELMKYTGIDSYGKVLHNKDLGGPDKGTSTLMSVMADYKFVLAFENTCSPDYVTEKFFNPLLAGTVPVYLGAPNVCEFAPGTGCFLDVSSFDSPAALADFMNRCYADEALYSRFHAWREKPLLPTFVEKLREVEIHPFIRLCRKIEEMKNAGKGSSSVHINNRSDEKL